ncbi:xanthine dehydrogenase family protein [Paracoccaceae bacterium Fryx2]|nr:xanthine dehydrogenase family protein [Paracoccaceae bacterium Fryx2]
MDGAKPGGAWIGRAMARREDVRLLTGRGRFVDDLTPGGALVLEVLRSPHGSGRIDGLDVTGARALPGVVAVFTAADLAGLGSAAVNALLPGVAAVPLPLLAVGRVQAVGQAVAAVVATSREVARDAVDLIVLDVAEDEAGPVPLLRHVWGAPFEPRGVPVMARVDHALVAPLALEPRAALAVPEEGGLCVWLSTQTPQRGRDDLCAILGIGRGRLRVIAPDVGGAFGGKASLMPEDALVALAALRLGQAVHWCATRSDEFQAATQGRGAASSGTLWLDADGRVRGLRAELEFPLGHWMPYSALAPLRNGGRILPGPYNVAAVEVVAGASLTNGAAVNIYRGAGRPEAAMLMERLMDRGAQALGLDPLELRRRNLALAPQVLPSGDRLCSGNFAGLLDQLERESGYAGLRAAQVARRAAGEVCGLGLALYVEPCGQGWETAEIRLMGDGRLVALTGSSAQG